MQLPEIISDTWYNSPPLGPADFKDKVVLVNFWAYSSVKCRRALPLLVTWWTRYRQYDFLLIGIHTPEFGFEKDPANVEQAIKDLGVEWPIALDCDYINWNCFSNRHWPSNYLFDRSGSLVFRQFGDAKFAETEIAIQEVLKQRNGDVVFPDAELDGHAHQDSCFIPTSDIYCGYARGRLDNSGGYNFDMPYRYSKPNGVKKDSLALLGPFVARPEYVESAGEGATLLLQFHAMEVNLVINPVEPGARLRLMFDGKPLPEAIRGEDISSSGELVVEKPALYNLIKSNAPLDGVLSVTAKQGEFRAYAFTFSGCASLVSCIDL